MEFNVNKKIELIITILYNKLSIILNSIGSISLNKYFPYSISLPINLFKMQIFETIIRFLFNYNFKLIVN